MAPPVEVSQGFPQPTTEYVEMSKLHRIQATTADNNEPLWTQHMSDCISVATYNTETGFRSLCHLPGGQYQGLISQLANIIDDSTVVIFTNGTSADKGFLNRSKENISKEIQDKHDASGKDGGIYRTYYTDPSQDASHGLTAGTFVIQADGRYGRVQAQQTQGQGQTSSRGLGNNQRKAGKRGFWRRMFCCCSC